MYVSMRIVAPSRFANNLSKKNIAKKGVKILAVDWDGGYVACHNCNIREFGI